MIVPEVRIRVNAIEVVLEVEALNERIGTGGPGPALAAITNQKDVIGLGQTRVIVIVKKAQVISGVIVIATVSQARNATDGVIIKRVPVQRRAPLTEKRTLNANGVTRRAEEAGAEVGAEVLTTRIEKRMQAIIIAMPFQRWNT